MARIGVRRSRCLMTRWTSWFGYSHNDQESRLTKTVKTHKVPWRGCRFWIMGILWPATWATCWNDTGPKHHQFPRGLFVQRGCCSTADLCVTGDDVRHTHRPIRTEGPAASQGWINPNRIIVETVCRKICLENPLLTLFGQSPWKRTMRLANWGPQQLVLVCSLEFARGPMSGSDSCWTEQLKSCIFRKIIHVQLVKCVLSRAIWKRVHTLQYGPFIGGVYSWCCDMVLESSLKCLPAFARYGRVLSLGRLGVQAPIWEEMIRM